jgi:hypothetical protein
VICRIQDPTMQQPPRPAPGVTVEVQFQAMAQASVSLPPLSATTGPDGIAAFTFQLNDPTSGVPIQVLASANYNGLSYTAQTFFTPSPSAKPSPSPCASPTGGPGNCGGNGNGH